MIEQLKSDKLKLTADLKKSHDHAIKATELQALVEEEATRLKLTIQAAEMDKQTLQQEVQSLTGVNKYLRDTTVKSVDEFLLRLKQLLYRSINISVDHRDNARQLFSAWKTGQEDDTKVLSAWNKFLY